jgi:hypothetical protein
MARYVVVEFSRNEDAEAFVDQINQLNKAQRKDGLLSYFPRRIVGVFVKPGKTCECSGREKGNYGVKNWPFGIALGGKFGWWVCTNCSKPRAAGHQLVNQLDADDTYEGTSFNGYEMLVCGLQISGYADHQIHRPKKLRLKRRKKVK